MNQIGHKNQIIREYKRGEIWRCNLDPTIGREQAKTRPCLIVSSNKLNNGPAELLIVMPITSRNRGIPSHIATNAKGLKNESFILGEQIRSISKERTIERIGMIEEKTLKDVEYWLTYFLDIGNGLV